VAGRAGYNPRVTGFHRRSARIQGKRSLHSLQHRARAPGGMCARTPYQDRIAQVSGSRMLYRTRSPSMSSMTNASPRFETSDLNLASFLRCRAFNIHDILHNDGRSTFVFDDSPALRKAMLDFANDGAVPVRSFCSTLRDLKALTR
jgi:uncharacterized protein DUF5659